MRETSVVQGILTITLVEKKILMCSVCQFPCHSQFPIVTNYQCEELTHWKRLWCWEGLGAGGERDDRGWDGWMASLIRWTWVWVNSGSWWWTGRPGVLRFMGSQRVRHDWVTKLNWTNVILPTHYYWKFNSHHLLRTSMNQLHHTTYMTIMNNYKPMYLKF